MQVTRSSYVQFSSTVGVMETCARKDLEAEKRRWLYGLERKSSGRSQRPPWMASDGLWKAQEFLQEMWIAHSSCSWSWSWCKLWSFMMTWSMLSGTSWKSCVWGFLMWYLQWKKFSQDLDDVGLIEILNCSWTKFWALRGCFACFWGHGAHLQKVDSNKLTFLTFKFCIISPVCTFCPREQWTRRCFSVLMNLQPFAIACSGRD